MAARQDRDSVLGREPEVAGRVSKAHAAKLGLLVLQGEVVVAARCELHAGNLSGDPEVLEMAVEQGPYGEVELAHGEDHPLRLEIQAALLYFHETSDLRTIHDCFEAYHIFLFDPLVGQSLF